ncbi:GTPase family protein [Phormidium sp. FACHB-592]|uniref:GTPase family protein n=1 Tax=Stenomitos frigidus AS-A4 TaxID=2933935 RepID=A0ABV0KHV6_9CYAN|nr:GTPase family protein [Phormidium sp. FACHB-592]MBD2074000.1 GTPase family protein [Phormidium sp. FACHB-592]
MVRLKLWQWLALGLPIASIVSFLVIAAGFQIQQWGISWIWGVVVFMFAIWRWLLVRWTQPALAQVQAVVAEVTEELEADTTEASAAPTGSPARQAEIAIQTILDEARTDPPLWDGWTEFWARCKQVVEAVAHAYYPQVQRPLLQIYVPQAYALMRGTVDDMDQWMQKLSPALNQVTIGQAYQAYEIYQKLEPSARKLLEVWNWAQWLLNPVAALARTATQRSSNRATQELLVNLGQLLREAALTNLGRQAIVLYGGMPAATLTLPKTTPALPKAKTQTLRDILTQAEPAEAVEQKPVNILLVGRTGAGKSSLINTLFVDRRAEVDVLPSTDRVQDYHWQAEGGESLTLWDTPGYEQTNRTDLREQVLDYITQADLLLLVTPALDPALQMDVDFLKDAKAEVADLPVIAVVTQVDRLRPLREWAPPYDWEWGDRPKEVSIRDATEYRAKLLGDRCNLVVPIVTGDLQSGRAAWNMDLLSVGLIQSISPAKQLRLARFLRNLDARTIAAAKIIDHYTFQMTTTQGLTTFIKSPVLRFISTLTTGSPTLAYLLAEQIPVEQLPIVLGKLQMAYDLFTLLNADLPNARNFDLLGLWPLLLNNSTSPDRNAWAFGHAVTEYWTHSREANGSQKPLTSEQLEARFEAYLQQYGVK